MWDFTIYCSKSLISKDRRQTVELWIEWAKGFGLMFALSFMILGMFRLLFLTLVEMGRIYYYAGNRIVPWKQVWQATHSSKLTR